MLLTLLEITVPVFMIIAAGFAALKLKVMPDSSIDPLVKYQVTIAAPCLLFLAMLRTDLDTAINPWTLLAFFASGTIIFILCIIGARMIFRRRPGEAVAVGFCAFFPNAVLLGIPITERAFGPETLAAVFGIIAFHSIYNWFTGFLTMEVMRRDSALLSGLGKAFMTTFSNPLMIGLMLGIVWNLAGLPLPGMIEDGMDIVAASMIPVALFSLGGVLTRYRLIEKIGEAGMITLFSLILHPALAWVLTAHVFALEPHFVQAAVIITAMPVGINSYIFASVYGRAMGTAASAVLLSTVCSLFTITVWLAVLGGG
ncbi:MAG: AEC family transporter [Pseudomonadota bacterium]